MSRRNTLWVGSLVLVLSGCAATRATTPSSSAPAEAPSVPPAPEPQPIAVPPPPARTTVSGSVTYLERIALTPEAVVRVEVVRQGPAQGQARVVGEQTIPSPGQVPIAFSLALTEPLDTEVGYVVRASITDGERLMSSREDVPVLTRGNPAENVSVRVSSAAGRRAPR